MGRRTLAIGGLATLLALVTAPGDRAQAKPSPCLGGRWTTEQLIGTGGATDTIVVNGRQVAIDGACAETRAKRSVTKARTVLQARWKRCGDDRGIVLAIRLDNATCETLTATFKKKKSKRRQVTGALAAKAVTQEELDQMRAALPSHAESAEQAAEDTAAAAALEAEDDAILQSFFDSNPNLADHYSAGVDPSDPTLASGDDGNYLHTIDIETESGAPGQQQVTTLGRKAQRAAMAAALHNFPTLGNQVNLYTDFYDWATEQDLVGQLQLEPPATLEQDGYSRVLSRNAQLTDFLFSNIDIYTPPPPGGLPPAGYPATCAAEENAGDGTDRTGGLCAHKALGVWENHNWGLKWFATCVKNQAARGTCVAMAMTGAVELMEAKKASRWVNLSEQYLYYMAKAVWWPSRYGDGLGTHDVWQRQITAGFAAPFERDWDYNPSWSRTANNTTQTYTNSCLGYGGDESAYCSNTNHQGRIFCVDVLSLHLCFAFPPPVVTAGNVFSPKTESELWDSSDPNLSLVKIILAVAIFRKPVMIALPVTPSFDGVDANGYITTVKPHCPVVQQSGQWVCQAAVNCECDRGGHALLATGIIDNTQLPAGAPAGAGGGYLIVKNSWGACWGDAGYVYIPYDWAKNMLYSATVLGDIYN